MTHLPAFLRTAALLAALGILLSAGPAARAQTMGDPEEFTAFAVNMGTYVVGTTANVIITVNRWTSTAERDSLLEILRLKGQEAFFNALKNAKRVGTLRTPESVGYDLRLAYDEPGKDGGRRILIATDRPIGFNEARVRPPSIDYPLTIIDMTLSPEGKGEGTMSVAAKLIPTGKNIVVENYDTQPVRLNRIESRKLVKR
jgi:hypothetical protein